MAQEKIIKKIDSADGTNNSERRFISTSSSIQADNGRNNITRSGAGQLF